jgi:hypothetical protein
MIKYLRWEMKYYLSKLRFYRVWLGGTWYKVRPKEEYGIFGSYWINRKPLFNEKVILKEVY